MKKGEGIQPYVIQVIIKGVAKGSFGGCVESKPETCRAGKSARQPKSPEESRGKFTEEFERNG